MKLYLIYILTCLICMRKCFDGEVANKIAENEDNVNSVMFDIGSQSNQVVNENLLVTFTENNEIYGEETVSISAIVDVPKVNEETNTINTIINAYDNSESGEKKEENIIGNYDSKATLESYPVNSPSPSYKIFNAFMNFLVELSVLILGASLIMMVIIIIKKKSLNNLNFINSQYDLIPFNKTEINTNSDNNSDNTDNTDKVIDDKLLESQLYDSNYELMATEIEDIQEERICIRDF